MNDAVLVGIVSTVGTAFVAVIGGIIQRRNALAGNNTTTQTKFYDNLMTRVQQLEAEQNELRELLGIKDREIYDLRLTVKELQMKAGGI